MIKGNLNDMSKEKEALEKLKEHLKYEWLDDFANTQYYAILKQALQRLEAIDNAEPSEALESLEEIRDFRYGKEKLLVCQTQMYTTIKQALQRLEENASEEILQKYYQEGITLDSVRALKQERDNYKKALEVLKKLFNPEKYNFLELYENPFITIGEKGEKYRIDSTDDSYIHIGIPKEEFDLLKEILGC